MRNMSLFHTQEAIRSCTKTVTRRRGWAFLKSGDRFRAIVKGRGLKKGEKVQVLAELECVSNKPEALLRIRERPDDPAKEGFPNHSTSSFIVMFCKDIGGKPDQIVNRIEFKYVEIQQ